MQHAIKINIYTLCLLLFLSACNSTTPLLTSGKSEKYKWEAGYGVGAIIEFQPDSTFIYDWQLGLLFDTTKGTWTQKRNKIILNSELQPEKEDFIVETTSEQTSQKTTIHVKNEKGQGLPFASCIINKTLPYTTDFDGNLVIDLMAVTKIEIAHIEIKPVLFMNKNKQNNVFTFVIKEIFPYYYFTNEKLIMKKGRLYNYKIKKNKFNEIYFVPLSEK